MRKHSYTLAILFLSFFVQADDKSYFIDRQNASMEKYRDDQTTLNLNFQVKKTDNHLFDKVNKQSTSVYELSPTLKSQLHNDKQMLQMGLWGKIRRVENYSEDNSTDTYGVIKYHHKLTHNQSMVISGALFNLYLDRGVGISKGQAHELFTRDHRTSYFINAAHQIGNEDSNAILLSTIGNRKTEFKNRLTVTGGLNLTANYLQFDFQYRLSGKTYLLSKLAYEDISHDLNVQQDRQVSSLLLGFKWHKTEFVHFDLSLGAVNINFEQGSLTNKTDFKWDAKFRWSPIDQIELSAFSIRSVDENRRVENSYLIRDKYGFNFSYKYTDRLELYLQSSFDKLENYLVTGNEVDQGINSALTLYYKFSRNMTSSLTYNYQDLNAFDELTNYQKNTISLGFSYVI
ncbi:MAG: outer membrane beta-barrel protein [Thalassotalea sp.]